jgi:hypothetical protein
MTQTNEHFSELNDDDMLPEYDFNQFGQGVRGKHAEAMRQGYSVTIHHEDGTSTTRHVPPSPSAQKTDARSLHGDYVHGNKIMGDSVAGDKIGRDKIIGNKIGTQINHGQSLPQAAKEIKDLLSQLDKDYDNSTPTGQAMIGANVIASIEKNPTLKARIVNALKEGGSTALEEAIDHPAVKPLVAMIKGFIDAK